MTAIANYFATLRVNINREDIRNVDKTLSSVEKRFKHFGITTNKELLKLKKGLQGFTLPALKIKSFKFDTLALQRNAQMSLNRAGRLLELPIHNFRIDEGKITKQLQGVMQRAANASRINIRSIQGSSGGSNAYYPKRPPAVAKGIASYGPQMPPTSFLNSDIRDGLAGAGAALLPGRLAMFSGPALAVAAPAAGAYMAQQQSLKLGNEQAEREQQRTALDIAAASPDRKVRDERNKRFFDLSNRLGVEAQSLVDPYSKFLKQMATMGRSYEQGMTLFENMSIGTRGSGGGQQQMERQAFALQQVIGLGHLRAEELNLQLSDSNPAIKKYIIEAWESRTGGNGLEEFQTAMRNRQVSVEDVFKAYENQARNAASRVEEFAGTVKGEQARLANLQFSEQLSRTLSDDVLPSMRKYVEAQSEVYEAMRPFRNMLYDAGAAVLSFNASLLNKSAPTIEKVGRAMDASSIVRDPISYLPAGITPATSIMQLGYLANKHLRFGANDDDDKFISPLKPVRPAWMGKADDIYNVKESIFAPQQTHSTTSVTVGDINLSLVTQATNGPELLKEVQSSIKQELQKTFISALVQSPQKE